MSELINFPTPPPLVIGASDHKAITALIDSAQGAELHEDLLTEIDRASVTPDGAVPADVVQMGSFVRFRTDEGQARDIWLVWPEEANIETGRISVLTPVGAALIGLRNGQSIAWSARNGKRHTLTVLDVRQDEDGPAGDGPGPQAA